MIGLHNVINSGVARGGSRGVECHHRQRKNCQKSGKRGKNREKGEESGRKGKNREGSFTLPLLTDGAGYTTSY